MLQKNQDFISDNNKIPPIVKKSGNFVIEVIKIVIISLVVIIPIRYFIIQPFYVKGASMEPNFYDYEYLIIDEISYRFNEPARGEVIVLGDPRNPARFFIKRVIGLPGERIIIKDNKVFIYSRETEEEDQLDESLYLSADVKTSGKIDISLSDNEYYVLGDNRPASLDSRTIGPIEKNDIVGKTWIRAWPFNKMEHFKTPIYNI